MITLSRLLSLIFLAVIWCVIFRVARLTYFSIVRSSKSRDPDAAPAIPINRWLRVLRGALIVLIGITLGFHAYWAFFAAGPAREDPAFVQLKRVHDLRNRRIEESGLRGWIFDRTKSAEGVLADYKLNGDELTRYYPLGPAGAHVVGYYGLLRGSAGAELAYGKRLRSSLDSWNLFDTRSVVGRDLSLTLDHQMQRTASELLESTGKPGAAVVVSVDEGDILVMASSPGFDPSRVDDNTRWSQYRADVRQPFVNRAMNQYYLPGSTFKVVVAASALENGLAGEVFECKKSGFRPAGSRLAIFDDGGEREVHGRIGLSDAIKVSCNQYFAQLGLVLGYERLGRTARKFGFEVITTLQQARERRIEEDMWGSGDDDLARVFGPNTSRIMLSRSTSAVDLALESYGQGYIQTTPMQMAMVSAAIANERGELMAARLDLLHKPSVRRTVLSSPQSEQLRTMLRGVTRSPGGTAYSAFASMMAGGLSAAGKTGTAQFELGELRRVDSWFIGFAPSIHPKIACAVVVEGGGYGGRVAAPGGGDLLGLGFRREVIGAEGAA